MEQYFQYWIMSMAIILYAINILWVWNCWWTVYFLSIFWLYHLIDSWTETFLLRNPPVVLWVFPCHFFLFPCCVQNSLSVTFDNLIKMCLISPFWGLSTKGTVGFKDLDVHFSPQIWGVFCHYCFKCIFFSFLFP